MRVRSEERGGVYEEYSLLISNKYHRIVWCIDTNITSTCCHLLHIHFYQPLFMLPNSFGSDAETIAVDAVS